ncbi:class I SAM-dependent methyltransferase [Candidatus Poribacteria bacterium]
MRKQSGSIPVCEDGGQKMEHSARNINEENRFLQAKYDITAWFYDILDYPWERQYRRWRPMLVEDVRNSVLEAGVGTGRNLKYYHPSVKLTDLDLSAAMLRKARKRGKSAVCDLNLYHEDATIMGSIPSNHFDWLICTFMCCVMPDELQPLAIEQFERVLKPGARFRLLEYGARFDHDTLGHVEKSSKLKVNDTYFVKKDVYMVIEGVRVD